MGAFFNDQRGMTLVEVITAAALVLIAAVSMGVVATQSAVFSRRIDTIYTASYLAQRRIDVLKRLSFSDISTAVETDVRVGIDGNIDANGKYLRSTEITPNFSGSANLIKVKVTVKRMKINMDGSILDPETGEMTLLGDPIIMETLFSDVT